MDRVETQGPHPAALPFLADDPAACAIADGRRTLTYSQLGGETLQMAAGLAARGIVRHRVVAAVLPEGGELASIMFACWQLGAALCPLDPELDPAEAGRRVAGLSPALVVVGDARVAIDTGAVPQIHVERLAAVGGQPPRTELRFDDVALHAWPARALRHAELAALVRHAAAPEVAPNAPGSSVLQPTDFAVSVCRALIAGGTAVVGGSPGRLSARAGPSR